MRTTLTPEQIARADRLAAEIHTALSAPQKVLVAEAQLNDNSVISVAKRELRTICRALALNDMEIIRSADKAALERVAAYALGKRGV